jgi:hypothetical protein
MPVVHPALRGIRELARRERAKLREAEHAVLTAYQPIAAAMAAKVADALEGRVRSSGEANLESFNGALEHLEKVKKLHLGYLQKLIMRSARLVMLKRMFGSALPAALPELQRQYGFTRIVEQAAITLPRRSGKTVAECILAALVAVSLPNGNCCCFQIGGRQAKAWLAQVIVYLRMFKGSAWDWKLEKIESKEYICITNRWGTTVMISSYPGPRDADASNFRGMGQDLALLLYDEFYFMREAVWSTTLPLAKLGSPILMTSSMAKSQDDAVRRMIYATMDDGERLFLLLDCLKACPDCVARNSANSCDHVQQRPQHFEPRGSLRRLKALMAPFGTEAFDRELLNTLAATDRLPVFRPEWLAPLRRPDWVYNPREGSRFYPTFLIGVDPAGGGFSRTAICSFLFDTLDKPLPLAYRLVILAAEVLPGKTITTDDLGRWVVEHIQHVRTTIPGMRNARGIVCIENNSILVASSVKLAIERTHGAAGASGSIGIMHENAGRRGRGQRQGVGEADLDLRAGTITTNKSKEEIANKVRNLLVEGGMQFHAQFCVPHEREQPPGESSVEDAKRLFVDELGSIHAEIVRGQGPRAGQKRPGIKFRGFRADGQKARDDKYHALGFCLQCYPMLLLAPHLVLDCVQPTYF